MIRRERRDCGEEEERGLRKGAEIERDKRELSSQFEEADKEHYTCLCLFPQASEFLTRICSKALQQ